MSSRQLTRSLQPLLPVEGQGSGLTPRTWEMPTHPPGIWRPPLPTLPMAGAEVHGLSLVILLVTEH